jgi:hypothetical protein
MLQKLWGHVMACMNCKLTELRRLQVLQQPPLATLKLSILQILLPRWQSAWLHNSDHASAATPPSSRKRGGQAALVLRGRVLGTHAPDFAICIGGGLFIFLNQISVLVFKSGARRQLAARAARSCAFSKRRVACRLETNLVFQGSASFQQTKRVLIGLQPRQSRKCKPNRVKRPQSFHINFMSNCVSMTCGTKGDLLGT